MFAQEMSEIKSPVFKPMHIWVCITCRKLFGFFGIGSSVVVVVVVVVVIVVVGVVVEVVEVVAVMSTETKN